MKTRKIILGLCLAMLGFWAQAQNGLENILVERYYVSVAADAAVSAGTLPVGSVTYRVYADMLPGYKFQAAYGTVAPAHTLTINTTTGFYNNEANGSNFPNSITKANCAQQTTMLDSWLSAGAACKYNYGVMKTEDDGVNTVTHPAGILANVVPQMGIGLWSQDGILSGNGTPDAVTSTPGSNPGQFDYAIGVFDGNSQNGNSFVLTDGAWSSLTGATGPTTTNRVLIGQFTTDGIFHFELNIQIGTPSGGTQNYVCANPVAGELTLASLTQTLYPAPQLPTVSITAPAINSTWSIGTPIAIAATAADIDGTVTQVEFFVDGISIGVDATAPYTATYTGLAEASHVLTAVATDNDGQTTTSTAVNFNVGNAPPVVSITAPTAGSVYIVGDVVAIAATASDPDGSVASVEFFVDGVSVGVDNTVPYTASYTSALGVHSLTAKATDNNGKFTLSAPVSITVNANQLPSVTITSPANNSTPALNAALTITATATDNDGTVSSVEFFNGATSLGIGTFTAPSTWSVTYTPAVAGPVTLSAKATDNKGGQSTAAVNVVITNFADAYKITFVSQECNVASVCMPISTVSAVQVSDSVNGYNFTVQYDKTKVSPTGNITVSTDLISPSILNGHLADYVTDYTTSIDAVAGKISIAIYFNANAGLLPFFAGSGDVCCVEFNRAGIASADQAVFSFTEIIESYRNKAAASRQGTPGNLVSFTDNNFAGSLKFWSDLSPIVYNPAAPSQYLITNITKCGLTAPAIQPDMSGNFTYVLAAPADNSIDVKRDIAPTTNVHPVITGQDSYITALVSVKGSLYPGWQPLVYQMIAMDVNRDGQVTAGDATQINQRAVSLIPQFSQIDGAARDWSFVLNSVVASDPLYLISTTYPENDGIGYSKYHVPVVAVCQSINVQDPTGCPIIQDENLISVMIGDVDGTYTSAVVGGGVRSAAADTAHIIVDLSKASFNGTQMSIPVSLTSAEVVHSFDFDLLINDLMASVQSVESQYSIDYSWNYIAASKMLSVSAFSLNAIPVDNTISIVLNVLTSQPITASDLTNSLALVNGVNANMDIIDATTGTTALQQNLVQVYPNPATDKLNVEVSVTSKVQMLDLNGKQVVAEQNVNANERQTIDVSNLSAGVYMVKIYNDKSVTMKKVIIKK